MIEENDIEYPKGNGWLTNNEILFGQPILPIEHLRLMDEDSFEDFIDEWAYYLKDKYVKVKSRRGAGDKGRDVIGVLANGDEDIYQCKHYGSTLNPSQMWIEFGKLCYYTFQESYKIPNKYYLVSPLGVGPKLGELIDKPEELKNGLIENWDSSCKNKISKKQEISLEREFLDYVKKIDASLPQIMIEYGGK